ncbi:type I phosphomannose isomerase catalytic subunit [Anaeromicrobium sediminis]|uniref:Phosphohexomutase n=1 Tax=Anaeromicrobium sediminis TaxID=1478221 RepID=A0A267ME82_9FIRM|nr:type I phosphomannose isomerase catalytic subunit [Anaeromicrobium sediminis]PAB57869.1 mannose-6-phosphate isomerase [Anaeromicrobium sediminis]
MYPLKFKPYYVEKVWGGEKLSSFKIDVPKGNIGESWELSYHKDHISEICNGIFKGKKLDEIIDLKKEKLLGTEVKSHRFPLLIKFLDAQQKLSVQVHPGDDYALKNEDDLGKTEVWVILDAKEDARLVLGTEEVNREEFKRSIEEGDLEKYLKYIPVKKGEIYFIKSGLIHTMEGVLVAEIQQNSNVTYRVYDYNRGRELHVDKALDVIDFNLVGKNAKGLTLKEEGYEKTYYCYDKNFVLKKYDVKGVCKEESDLERFFIFMCIDGDGKIIYTDGEETIKTGETLLIPASLGKYSLEGSMSLLKTYVPNLEKFEKDILNRIKY